MPRAVPCRLASQPNDGNVEQGKRYTLHRFPGFYEEEESRAPQCADAQFALPKSSSLHDDADADADARPRPSKIILDYWYGCVVLKAWGQKRFKDYLKKVTRRCYPRASAVGGLEDDDDSSEMSERSSVHSRERFTWEPSGGDMDDILDCMFGMAVVQGRIPFVTEEEERQCSVDKVNEWLR